MDAHSHTPTTQYSLAFEKASLLFNLASIYSHIAADSDEVKVRYANCQAAAGVYGFILQNFLHAPSTDLAQDTVKALSKLMLAQAQEAFLDKLLGDATVKHNMAAKVAKAASTLYKTAGETLQGVYTSKSWGDRAWHQYANVKAKYFAAVSSFERGMALEDSSKYGEACAWFNVAATAHQEAARMPVPSAYQGLREILTSAAETSQKKAKEADKDNDLIYHEVVPPAASLTEVAGLEAAKPTPINELYNEKEFKALIGRDLFEKVIPLAVHEKASMYSEEKAKLLREEGDKVEVANEELSSALEFLDLPASLRLVKDDEGNGTDEADVPVIVQDWAAEVSMAGSQSFETLEKSRNDVGATINKAQALIDRETSAWQDAKARFGDRLTQTSPQALGASILGDVKRIRESLAMGATSDSKIRALIDPYAREIALLRAGPSSRELQTAYTSLKPSGGAAGSAPANVSLLDMDAGAEDELRKLVSQTENLLSKLHKVRKERDIVYKELKDAVHRDDISSLLILNRKVPNVEEQLFKSELAKFQPQQGRIDTTIHHQRNLVKELTDTWKRVLANDTVRHKTASREGLRSQRQALLERFRKAYHAWTESRDGLTKGDEFYSRLASLAASALSNAEQFVSNREEERRNLSASLSQSSQYSAQQLLRDFDSISLGSRPGQSPAQPSPQFGSQQPYQSSYQTSGSFGFGNDNSGAPPALPPKPGPPPPQQQPQGPYYGHPREQVPPSDPYTTPSAYDSSLYGPSSPYIPSYSYQQRPDDRRP